MPVTQAQSPTDQNSNTVRPVAVIDVGATSIRMAVAEISTDGTVRTLESLSQAVNLGKDTFTKGNISKNTIEECVRVLKSYKRVLKEYLIDDPKDIRVVATSSVREAGNRLAFLDRIYSATGMQIEPIDEAEVNRITYLAIQSYIKADPNIAAAKTIITEVGGGSTELLVVQNGDVVFSHTFRLGSMRLRETLAAYQAPRLKARHILESQIERSTEQLLLQVPPETDMQMIVLGGDVRFAATQLLPDWQQDALGRLNVSELAEFTDNLLAKTEDELVHKYHLTLPEAETIGPALLSYAYLARLFHLEHILISRFNLRDGLLNEMALDGLWTDDLCQQMVRSAINLGRKFSFNEGHALQVAQLSQTIFDALQSEHQLAPRYRLLLYVAAILHEIGNFISIGSHHKHSMYLILNSELFGLSKSDLMLVALVARYHRRAAPKATHQGYSTLDREQRIAISQMAAILRVADALERSHSQRIKNITCEIIDRQLLIHVPNVHDFSLEQLALKQKGSMFEDVFGLQVQLITHNGISG